MNTYSQFAPGATYSVSATKMAIYRALCQMTNNTYQVEFGGTMLVNGSRQVAFGFEKAVLPHAPDTGWSVMVPVRFKIADGSFVHIGFFMTGRHDESTGEGKWTTACYWYVTRAVVVWSEDQILTYDFNPYNGTPKFQFDELGRMPRL